MRPIEAIPALFLLTVAAGIFFGTAGLSYWNGPTPGARFFPAILAGTATAVALLLLWAQSRGIERVEVDLPSPASFGRVTATVALLVALAAGAPVIGFVPMLAVFVLAVLLGVLRQRLLPSLLTAAIVAGFVHLVFLRWLSVPMPAPFGI